MLVLSRKVGEGITLSGGIRISVSQIRGDRVNIGIEAPKSVNIRRDELGPPSVNAARVAFQQNAEERMIRLTEQQLLEAVGKVAKDQPGAAAAIAAFAHEVAGHSEDRSNFGPLFNLIDSMSKGNEAA